MKNKLQVLRSIWSTLLLRFSANKYGKLVGFKRVYANFNKAEEDLIKCFDDSKVVRILVQIGHDVIGVNNSLLFEKAKLKKEFKMQFLYAGRNSNYPVKDASEEIRRIQINVENMIDHVEESIRILIENDVNIQFINHYEPDLWRLFFFDDVLFFIPSLCKKDNKKQAPVFKFERSIKDDNSLYEIFSTYFNELWARQAQNEHTSNLRPSVF